MKITFYGGARQVTGANYHIDAGHTQIVVDCGLNQGSKYAEDLNYDSLPYAARDLEYAFITHSHIDHVGRFPKLYKDGFRGTIFCTHATKDLIQVALPDNLKHITNEAKDDGHEPLFNQKDLDGMISQVKSVDYDQIINLGKGMTAQFHDAGHILGSSIVEINWQKEGEKYKIFFSGDLGNPPTPLLRETEFVENADYLVVESAYGDRVHEAREERKKKLVRIIEDTVNRKGVLMIPSFAMERTQELLYELNELHNNKKIPEVPIFIDSPLAIRMTEVYRKHARTAKKHENEFNKGVTDLVQAGDDIFKFPGLHPTLTVDESKMINDVPSPKIIIAGSGMSQGGRILHHELRYLDEPDSTILFVGYQVDGSLGRRIQRGDKEVRVMGRPVQVRCHVESISSYSAHADQSALLEWVKHANKGSHLKQVFVVQGEETASKTLAYLIRERYGIEAIAPEMGQEFNLGQ